PSARQYLRAELASSVLSSSAMTVLLARRGRPALGLSRTRRLFYDRRPEDARPNALRLRIRGRKGAGQAGLSGSKIHPQLGEEVVQHQAGVDALVDPDLAPLAARLVAAVALEMRRDHLVEEARSGVLI